MILRPYPISTNRFCFITGKFMADASDLEWRVGEVPLEQVFDDACDIGLTLISAKTGEEIVFALEEETRNTDYTGGWSSMRFLPADQRVRQRLQVEVVIFND